MHDRENLQNETATSRDSEKEDQPSLIEKGRLLAADSLTDAEKIYGDSMRQVTALVRKHPLEAMAIGFGVGCLVGLVLARRPSS